MKFGKVDNPNDIDFTLPSDHLSNPVSLKTNIPFQGLYMGSAKWNRQYLKGLYPRGTKDELSYYATQFNSIELNSTFYNNPQVQQIEKWRNKVSKEFRFFPKVHQYISHVKRLKDTQNSVEEFCQLAWSFEEKLGMPFLQMPENFAPKHIDNLIHFIEKWPAGLPLAFELRNEYWYTDQIVFDTVLDLFRENNITFVITDTPGRRDMLHMALTTNSTFIRFVSSYHELDFQRIDDWSERLRIWKEQGLESINFFLHQDMENDFTFLATYLAKKLNQSLGTAISIPRLANLKQEDQQIKLF